MTTENNEIITSPKETMEALYAAVEKDKTLYKRLRKYADDMISRYYNGKELWFQGGEILGKLLNKIERGDRKWKKERCGIESFLFKTTESVVRNELKRKELKITRGYTETGTINDDYEEEYSNIDIENIASKEEDEEFNISKNEHELKKILEDKLIESGDEECIDIYGTLESHKISINKNNEIAEKLGWTVSKVENVKKRFFRIGERAKKEYFAN